MRFRSAPAVLASLLLAAASPAEEEKSPVVEDGRKVSIEYTLSLADGTTADTNVGEEPLVYQQGGQQILPALEEALAGMKTGDSKSVNLTAEQGYGTVDESLFQEVDAELIPEEARHAGAQLVSQDPMGNQRLVRVHEVRDDTIVLDLNHPLAGQALHFDVRIVGIE